MKTVLQGQLNGLCLVACCAMLTNKTLIEVLAEIELTHDKEYDLKYLRLPHAVQYLSQNNLLCGITLQGWKSKDFDIIKQLLTIELDLQEFDAIVTVKSQTMEGCCHCIVWDKEVKQIRDPQHKELRNLKDYDILEWLTISEFKDKDVHSNAN